MIALLILFGLPTMIIAGAKGFKSVRWLLACGVVGFIWVLSLKSAKASGISPEESARRARKADSVGAWLCVITVGLAIVEVVVLVSFL